MKHVTIIATSLNDASKSQVLAHRFEDLLKAGGTSCERFDLRELELPFAGESGSWEAVDAAKLQKAVEASSHVVFAVPIYCFDVNAAAKNVIELIGRTFTKKIVSFICTAAGSSSYMAAMGLANHLMLDFRSVIVPRFLYVESSDWGDNGALSPAIEERMARLQEDMKSIQVLG